MKRKLDYTREELMADAEYVRRIVHNGRTFHGGFNECGTYVPPRSLHRLDAIETWTAQLEDAGHPVRVIELAEVEREFFPNVEQSKILLRCGATGAMTRILTLIGITEGFGNDGLRSLPVVEFEQHFVETVAGTCLAHIFGGLFEAHGNDEAGRGDECGHDTMWYVIRDSALNSPEVTPDMFENLPITPPPGYQGPARAAPEAIGPGRIMEPMFPSLDPMCELVFKAMAQILVIELMAYSTFDWAGAVLSDPECSTSPAFAARMVGYIQHDENIHVAYLQCALAEARTRTMIGADGSRLDGAEVIDTICKKAVSDHSGERWARMLRYRMGQIRNDLEGRDDAETVLAEFAAAGIVPEAVREAPPEDTVERPVA